ncbi:MAG: hypothetical protein HXY18_00900 [Bryobacteraceae bacterium]|nr:hypothetical protein [Bryobacteraceae bacterium]
MKKVLELELEEVVSNRIGTFAVNDVSGHQLCAILVQAGVQAERRLPDVPTVGHALVRIERFQLGGHLPFWGDVFGGLHVPTTRRKAIAGVTVKPQVRLHPLEMRIEATPPENRLSRRSDCRCRPCTVFAHTIESAA